MNKEFIEKAKKLESVDEIKELAQRENIELSEEELSKIAGGSWPLIPEYQHD